MRSSHIKPEPSHLSLYPTSYPTLASDPGASANPPPLSSDQRSIQRDPTPRAASGSSASSSSSRSSVVHPYARLYAKKEEGKRRKIWNHAFEKSLFNPFELLGFWPVSFDQLEPFKGLNSKTAKSKVAGLQHDFSQKKMVLLEQIFQNEGLEQILMNQERMEPSKDHKLPSLNFDYSKPGPR